MLRALLLFTIICLVAPGFSNADVLSGTTIDTISGNFISGVKVKVATPACSTTSDAQGKFSITIISTAVKQPPGISRTPTGFSFSGYSAEAKSELIDLTGRRIAYSRPAAGLSVPPGGAGIYFFRISEQGRTDICKIDQYRSQSFPAAVTTSGGRGSLAKTLATSYALSFSKSGYNTAVLNVVGAQTNLVVKLSPTPSNDVIGITRDTTGQVNGQAVIVPDN